MNKAADGVNRAKQLLKTVRHAALATVNEDGSPHNSPVYFQYDSTLEHFYWGSSSKSRHSVNVARSGQVFLAIYEANAGGGLYISAAAHMVEGEELEKGLSVLNVFRERDDRKPLDKMHYSGASPQRMYVAHTKKFWVNISERDKNDNIIKDYRQEVSREDLL